MRRVSYLVALCLILSTAQSQAQDYLREQTKKEIAAFRADIGRKFWVSPARPFEIADRLAGSHPIDTIKYRKLRPGSWLVVKDLVLGGGMPADNPAIYVWKHFQVQTEDGQTGYVNVWNRSIMLTEDPTVTAKKAADRRQGGCPRFC